MRLSLVVLFGVLSLGACKPPVAKDAIVDAPEPAAQAGNVNIIVNREGDIFWNGEKVTEEELDRRLGGAFSAGRKRLEQEQQPQK